jgi:hypothetical protein
LTSADITAKSSDEKAMALRAIAESRRGEGIGRLRCSMLLLLWVMLHDGTVHKVDDGAAPAISGKKGSALAMARVGARNIVADGGKLTGVPGKFPDVIALAGGKRLVAASEHEVFEVDIKTGARKPLAHHSGRVFAIAADGEAVYALVVDGTTMSVAPAGGTPTVLPGRPLAIAAAAGHVFVATREGPLWQLDVATSRRRDLGLGGWWGTLALAADATHVYAVTVSGKIWSIDIVSLTKTAVSMGGWESAAALSVD